MKLQFLLQQIQVDKQNALLEVKNFNAGESIEIMQDGFSNDFLLPDKASIWQEKIALSPTLKYYTQAEGVANQQVSLTKTKALPDLTVGYNYQGFSSDNVSGLYAGVSLPIWGNKLRKSAAQSNYIFSKSNSAAKAQTIKSEFDVQFNKHQSLLKVYNQYSGALEALNSENLLLKAYQLGEIAFSEYYIELEFYYNAYDALLDMELQLHLLKTQILNHQL